MESASSPTPTRYPGPGRADHDPEELWTSFAATLRRVTERLDDPGRVASIAVASVGEAAVPLDSRGDPTGDIIAWFDGRAGPQAVRLGRAVGQDRLFGLTGLSLQPIFGLCKLLWLKENEPDAYSRTATWLNVADFMAFRLCGVAATDFSLASRTLALNLQGLRWADELLEEVGIPPDLFAPLRKSGSPLGPVSGEAASLTGLPEGACVAAGGHDHVCGALAVGVTSAGTMLNSLGTAEAIFLPLERPLTDPKVGTQGYTQGAHVAGGYYVFGGQYTSGASVEWLRGILDGAGYDTLIPEAESVPPGSFGAFFLPHLRLANPPYDDPAARGAFVGLSTDVGRGALFRSVLEGLAYDSRGSLEPLLAHADLEELQRHTRHRRGHPEPPANAHQSHRVEPGDHRLRRGGGDQPGGRHPRRGGRRRLRRHPLSPRSPALRRIPRRASPGRGRLLRRRFQKSVQQALPQPPGRASRNRGPAG